MLFAVLLGTWGAQAETQEVPLLFDAPCGSASEFARGIEGRLPQLSIEPVTEDPAVRVEITAGTHSAEATLTILLEEGGELTRSIAAADCRQALEAIQFVTAVALDPEAPSPVQVRRTLPAAEEQEPSEEGAASVSPPEVRQVVWSVGGSGLATWGAAPQVMPGAEMNLGVGLQRAGWWSPSLMLGLGVAARGGFERTGGTAGFQTLRASLDLCPMRGRAGVFSLRPCVQTEFARVRAAGTETIDPAVATRPWIMPGVSLIVDAEIARHVSVILRGALGVPLVRDAFDFDGVVFHEVAPFGGTLGLGVAAQF